MSFFKCEEAASDKGSYFEQDKLLELDGLDEEQDEAVPVISASRTEPFESQSLKRNI